MPATESRDVTAVRYFDAAALSTWTVDVFKACGVDDAPARLAADILARTSLRGIDTHGISRVPVYAAKLKIGEVNASARPVSQFVDGALHIDGDGGLGQVVATFAVDEAIARAQTTAVVACSIRNSGHLSALGMFTLRAAERGYVAMLCQKTPPNMAMPGSTSPVIGNNPIAFAAASPLGAPLVFDMANSVVARGQVIQALRDGHGIPDDWALGPDGAPTIDPARAMKGAMRPAAGHKGIGLAMMVECLAASLTGALQEPAKTAPLGATSGSSSGISAFLMVIDPALFIGKDAFDASMSSWLRHYLSAGGPQARYPGQRQAACEAQRLADGVPVPESVLRELHATGESVGVPFDVGSVI
ncbi:Ldh family oxidoreductase [soil metagenome]